MRTVILRYSEGSAQPDTRARCFGVPQHDIPNQWIFCLTLLLTTVATAQPTSNRTTQPTTSPAQIISLDALFTTLDKNHDGRISKEEATGSYAQRFAQWDADNKGYATRQNIHDFRARLGIDDNGQRIANPNRPATGASAASAPPVILKEPADWRFERLPVPPTFAPTIKMTGTEEARFAPGMFKTAEDTYFTYLIAITADGAVKLDAPELKGFLEQYFGGLSAGRTRKTGAAPDPSQTTASVTPNPDATDRFNAQVTFLDPFTDGRKVTLHIEAHVIPQPATRQTCLILLLSPSSKDSSTWASLRELGKKAEANVP